MKQTKMMIEEVTGQLEFLRRNISILTFKLTLLK